MHPTPRRSGTPAARASSRRRPRRYDSTGTREALLAAAAKLFAARGFEGVPVEAIAAEAGVNKAMINYHFGGKRPLYRAIVSSTFAEIIAGVEALAASSRPVPALLRDLVALIGEMALRHPHFPAMMLREVLSGGRRLDRELVGKPVRVLGAVARIVERGVGDGTLRPVDPLFTHLGLVGSMLFFFATAPFRERLHAEGLLPVPPPDPMAYIRHLQDLVTRGLVAQGDGAAGPAGGSDA
jgi:TetR/AcrR family transcriptional regulator